MSPTALLPWIGPYLVWFWTAVIVGIGALVYAVLTRLIRRIREPKTRITLSRVVGAVVAFFVLVAILALWVQSTTVFVLVAGLVSAGVAFSLQGPLTSLVAWLAILILRPFEIGDRVRCGEVAGDVVGFNAFFFSLLEIGEWNDGDLYTGRLVEVPNNRIMTTPLRNYSRNFRFLWDSVVVGVYYDADWARAREIALGVAQRISASSRDKDLADLDRFRERYFMPRGRLEPQAFLSLASTSINIQVRYVTPVWDRTWTRTAVVEGILSEFAAAGIDIAYPSVVLQPPGTPAAPREDEKPAPTVGAAAGRSRARTPRETGSRNGVRDPSE